MLKFLILRNIYFKKIGGSKKTAIFATLFREKKIGAFSSAGSEHLPYKQGVDGSNPSTPT